MTTLATPPSSTPPRRDGPPPSLRDLDLETLIALYPPKMEPMSEGIPHLLIFVHIIDALIHWFGKSKRDATVFGDIMLYYRDERDEVAAVASDGCVIFGVDPERINTERSYFIERVGKIPALVMEIASSKTARRDLEDKPGIYAHIGIEEYWMVDPTGGDDYGFALKGLRLVDGAYEEIELKTMPDGSLRGLSEVLGLELRWEDLALRLFDPASGEYLRTREEFEASEREALARAQAAEERIQDAEARARNAEAELARLREQLGT